MTTQISFTADKSLKNKAMEKAKKEGITLKAFLTYSMRSYVEGKMKLDLVATNNEPEVEELIFDNKKIHEKAAKLAKLLKISRKKNMRNLK